MRANPDAFIKGNVNRVRAGAVLHVRLNRPAKRNSISDELLAQLHTVWVNLPGDVRAVVLSGEGQHFCAGLDLSEVTERNVTEGMQHSRAWHACFDAIQYGRELLPRARQVIAERKQAAALAAISAIASVATISVAATIAIVAVATVASMTVASVATIIAISSIVTFVTVIVGILIIF